MHLAFASLFTSCQKNRTTLYSSIIHPLELNGRTRKREGKNRELRKEIQDKEKVRDCFSSQNTYGTFMLYL